MRIYVSLLSTANFLCSPPHLIYDKVLEVPNGELDKNSSFLTHAERPLNGLFLYSPGGGRGEEVQIVAKSLEIKPG